MNEKNFQNQEEIDLIREFDGNIFEGSEIAQHLILPDVPTHKIEIPKILVLPNVPTHEIKVLKAPVILNLKNERRRILLQEIKIESKKKKGWFNWFTLCVP